MTIQDDLRSHVAVVETMVAESVDAIGEIVDELTRCFDSGHRVLICGNGGSAADAQHFAAEFVNRMHHNRDPWPAVALTTDTSVLTSIANDASYDAIFSRQVEALGMPGDVLIGLSTSGKSTSVLSALEAGQQKGLTTIGFTGDSGVGPMRPFCDLLLAAPSRETPRVQEAHEFAYHVIARLVEERLVSRAEGPRVE